MSEDEKRPRIYVPPLCRRCQHKTVKVLRIGRSGPWQSALVIVQILLFQYATSLDELHKAAEGKIENMSGVLHEIGCLACRWPHIFHLALDMMKRKGLDHAAQVSQAKRDDPDWPVRLNAMQAKQATPDQVKYE